MVFLLAIVQVSDYGLSRSMTVNHEDNTAYYREHLFRSPLHSCLIICPGTETSRPLPLRWLAVEAIVSKKFTEATDVYAFGVTVGEVYTRAELPFSMLSDTSVAKLLTQALRSISQGHAVDPVIKPPPNCPPLVAAVMRRCGAMRAEERPTFEAVLDMLKQDAVVAWGGTEDESKL